MAAHENLSTQFTDKRGKMHKITADRFGSVEARSGKTTTGRLGVMLNFYAEDEQKEKNAHGKHLIYGINVHQRYKRRGIATAMYNFAEQQYGPIEIGDTTEQGSAWKQAVQPEE